MLEIRDLVKIYPGPVAALQGVTLEVPRGMFGLLGPNSAGKTTLMRIVSGFWIAGYRWADEDGGGGRSVVSEDYRDARTEVELEAGESVEFVIRAGFEPGRVVVDPDMMVLQLSRNTAGYRFER